MFFVPMSDGFLGPGTFRSGSRRLACCSWIHRTSTSTCLSFDMPWSWTIPIAALASIPTLALISGQPKSFKSVRIPNASEEARTTAYSSDSPLDLAMTAWVLE